MCTLSDKQRSLSTYTIRASGATRWATWWVLSAVGSPVPMSRNWRMPSWPARYRTARPKNARSARAWATMIGSMAATLSPASRSTAKLSLPPSQ
jgi:hypothetical protein